ncbi:hypothetical protein N9Y17_04365 [Gammaproteobacteria bacterium]|nr:hypothetical protein [Gammaproteobacteria bacterium]
MKSVNCTDHDIETIIGALKSSEKNAFFTIDDQNVLKHLKRTEIADAIKRGVEVFYVKKVKPEHNYDQPIKEYAIAQLVSVFLPNQPLHEVKRLIWSEDDGFHSDVAIFSKIHPQTCFNHDGNVAHQTEINAEYLLAIADLVTLSYILGNDDLKPDSIVPINTEDGIKYALVDFTRFLIILNFYIRAVSENNITTLESLGVILADKTDNSMGVDRGQINKELYNELFEDEEFLKNFHTKSLVLFIAFIILDLNNITSLNLFEGAESILTELIEELKERQNCVHKLLKQDPIVEKSNRRDLKEIYQKARTLILENTKPFIQNLINQERINLEEKKEPPTHTGKISLLLLIFLCCLATSHFYPALITVISLISFFFIAICGLVLLYNQPVVPKLPVVDIANIEKNDDLARKIIDKPFKYGTFDEFNEALHTNTKSHF